MLSKMALEYTKDSIFDAFLICGYHVSQIQIGYRMSANDVIRAIEDMERLMPCLICKEIPVHGWISHAISNHCDGLDLQPESLKVYRFIKGAKCLICNHTYANEEEKQMHMNFHLDPLMSPTSKLPSLNEMTRLGQTPVEMAVRINNFVHHHLIRTRKLQLYIMVPVWLRGTTPKEKLGNVDRPTYIPISLNYQDKHLNKFKNHYDIYAVDVYIPAFDESFNGIRSYTRMFAKTMIRILCCIKQQPAAMRFINFQFQLHQKYEHFMMKYAINTTDDDIRQVIKDVVTNHRTIVCVKELFEENGCKDSSCTSFVHFDTNFTLISGATNAVEHYVPTYRYYDPRFNVGRCELILNPPEHLWIEFANELIKKKNFYASFPTPYFVYIVLCCKSGNTLELPSFDNMEQFTENEHYSVYTGYSFLSGIPPHHHRFLFQDANVPPDEWFDNQDDMELQPHEGSTELTKLIKQGHTNLYMFRNNLKNSYEQATALEAAIQLYGFYTNDTLAANNIKIINKRVELSALSYLSFTDIQSIMKLISEEISLFYESPNDYQRMERTNINWGIFEQPFLLSDLQKLPL